LFPLWLRTTTLSLAAVSLPVVALPAAQHPALTWQSCAQIGKDWAADTGGDTRSECTTVQVPLDYAHPDGRKITLAVSRIKATDPAHRRGVLMLNPGGPGEMGTYEPQDLGKSGLAAVNQDYDLVGFDIRGSGYSDKIACPELAPENIPRTADDSEQAAKATADVIGTALRTCAGRDLDLARSMTTTTIARDMDQIRVALGEHKISYFGNSWGTALGAVYRSLFDQHVDRMVLDSVMAPGQSYDQVVDQGAATEEHFRRFAAWIAGYDGLYHFGRTGDDVASTLLALRDDLTAHPRPGGVTGDWATSMLVAPEAQWATAAKNLAAVRDGQPPTTAQAPSRAVGNGFGDGYVDGEISFVIKAVDCNDSPAGRDFDADWNRTQQLKSRYPVGGSDITAGLCVGWPLPAQPWRLAKGNSTLQLSAHAFETNTVLPWAEQMQERVGGSLLVVQNDVHSSLKDLPCAKVGVDALVDGVTVNGTCPGAPVPTP
jgi:pimeloyl-ACP methyl ester carboxylesterase